MGLVSTVLLVLAPAACRKESAAPSEAYEQAHQRFSKLYAQKLDGAFVDPAMDEIEALLDQVPADSMDAQSARELKQRIADGRERAQAQQQETEEALAGAREVDTGSAPERTQEPESAPPAPAAADAGTPGDGPVEGSPASELSGGYLGCFQRGRTITVEGRGARESWEMSDRARCSQTYPKFVGQVVLVEDGKVLTVLPKSAFRVTWKLPDGGVVEPDGGR